MAVKATALDAAIRDMAAFVGPDTVILSLLNGITSEGRLDAAYPGRVLGCVAIGMDANRNGRDLVYKAPGKLQFGELDGAMTPRVAAVARYFEQCGIACEPCADIRYKLWYKLMINVGLNQASAAFGLTYGGLAQPGPPQDRMLEALGEVIRLARAEGVPLPDDAADVWLAQAMPTFKPDNKPSMGQDADAHRPTEVEEFAGTVRRLSARHGLPPPANDFFYQRIRAMEAAWPR